MRKIFAFKWTAAWCTVLVAVLWLWWFTGREQKGLGFTRASAMSSSGMYSGNGKLFFFCERPTFADPDRPTRWYWVREEWDHVRPTSESIFRIAVLENHSILEHGGIDWNFAGIRFLDLKLWEDTSIRIIREDWPHAFGLAIPFWIISTLITLGTVRTYLTEYRRVTRAARGHCAKCGYDLRATSDRCPECGTQVTAK
jgi:hypothetical protein